MFRYSQKSIRFLNQFSTSTTIQSSAPTAAPIKPTSRGSTFFERLLAFTAGLGVGFGISFYQIYDELVTSNGMCMTPKAAEIYFMFNHTLLSPAKLRVQLKHIQERVKRLEDVKDFENVN